LRYLRSGDVFLGWLSSGVVARADFLEGQSSGKLIKKDDLSINKSFFGIALEAADATSASVRFKVQVK
jgi:hypothetical protein